MPYDTSVLDRALSQRQAQWEADRQQTLAHCLELLDELSVQFDLHTVYLFGSLVQSGRFTDVSDIDMAVESLPITQHDALAGRLSARLGREVDLLHLPDCHFAAKIRREGLQWTRHD